MNAALSCLNASLTFGGSQNSLSKNTVRDHVRLPQPKGVLNTRRNC